jgi:HK97 family phage portal protein
MAWWRWNTVPKLSESGFFGAFFGQGTYTGRSVDPEKALTIDSVWACTKLLSETLGTLPCLVLEQGTNKPAVDHPYFELLHDMPNLDMTSVEYWEAIGMGLCLFGNAYSEKILRPDGRVAALNLLQPGSMTVDRDRAGRRVYLETTGSGKTRTLSEDRIFHVRGMSFGGDTGLSPVEYGRHTMAASMATEEASGRLFGNGMAASGVLTSDQLLTAKQRADLKAIMETYVGSSNAGKLMILEAGLKYQQLVMDPQKAQMLEVRQYQVEQICRWFGVPSIMIGHHASGGTTWGSGVEQIMLAFSKQGMRSLCKRVEAAIRRDLLTPEDRKRITVKFNMDGLLRGDAASRAAFLSTMVNNGIMTRNEARGHENLPAKPGGDDLTVQSAMLPIQKLGAALPAPAPQG